MTTGIKINSDDTHTILLRPSDEDKEVRILVDTTGDGNTDDTLVIQNNSGIEDVLMARYDLQLFPNPATKTLQLNMQNLQSTSTSFKLIDIQGKVVFVQDIAHGSNITSSFDVSHLARGVYTAEITTYNNKSTLRKKGCVEIVCKYYFIRGGLPKPQYREFYSHYITIKPNKRSRADQRIWTINPN